MKTKNKEVEKMFQELKAEAIQIEADQFTFVMPMGLDCDCGGKSIHYGVYWDKFGRLDFMFCDECFAHFEVDDREGERIELAFQKVLSDFQGHLEAMNSDVKKFIRSSDF